MTKVTDNGVVAQRIADDLAQALYRNEMLYKELFDRVLDLPGDTADLQRALNELRNANVQMFIVQVQVRDGQLKKAEAGAMTLASSRGGTVAWT